MNNSKIQNKYINIIKLVLSLFLFFFTTRFIFLIASLIIKGFNIDINDDNVYVVSYIIQFIGESILVLLLILLYKKDFFEDFKKFKKNFWEISDKVISYWTIGLVVMAVSNILIGILTPVKEAANEQGVQEIIKTVPVIAVFLTTFLAPFAEELTFRKAFKDVFKERSLFITISGVVFGALHVVLTGSNDIYQYLYLIPYSALGIAFAAICYDTDNIWSSIFAHFLHNGILTIISIVGSAVGMMII